MESVKKLLPVMFFLVLAPLFARDVEIIVEDTELGLPLEGAAVRSWDGREYVCDEDGRALVSVPDNRQVVIQAAYPGYESGRLVVVLGADRFTLGLRLSGIMESRELVIEAARPGQSETKTGRSVGVNEREIAQTAEIGIIEDVMSTIKLLPGVGYAGMFNAQPSIRGGDPGDTSAVLDGFYIGYPYHWGGGFSIFDPRMVQSAQLSHGVFSARYGHTISGLLEISAKKPSSAGTEFELSVNTSSANFNLSLPFARRGGVMFMGRTTYYDPVIALAKQLTGIFPELEVINAIRVAPYIRNFAITADYRFFDDLELQATGFLGMDGVGVSYNNFSRDGDLYSRSDMIFDYTNYLGFVSAALSWNPRNDMLLKTIVGTGFEQSKIDGTISNDLSKKYSGSFKTILSSFPSSLPGKGKDSYSFRQQIGLFDEITNIDTQGRIDYDWELGKGFLAAAGIQEMFSVRRERGNYDIPVEFRISSLSAATIAQLNAAYPGISAILAALGGLSNEGAVMFSSAYAPDVENRMLTSSAYTLLEYHSPNDRFAGELGLRLDHAHLFGQGFTISSRPVLNPRLNVDVNIFRDKSIFRSLDISAGTGLFSSINNIVLMAEQRHNMSEGRPNRSWTSVLGTKLEFLGGINFNIEGYYKHIYDRAYIPVEIELGEMTPKPYLDGVGRVWGIDLMLQKLQSRYWDGWISYSYSYARYHDPHGQNSGLSFSGGNRENDWYFPSYHRFHNLNLILNIKPVPRINIYTRFGFASGVQILKVTGPILPYPVYVAETGEIIEKYRRQTVRDENNRTSPSLPLDIKFSILGNNEKGKTRYELYVAVENVLALLYNAQGNTSFNSYTGEEDTGSTSASYEIPIPIPSFGFKISY